MSASTLPIGIDATLYSASHEDEEAKGKAAKKAKNTRTVTERASSKANNKFEGFKHKRTWTPICMQINSKTPILTVVMWIYLCLACLTACWFAVSMLLYLIYSQGMNKLPPGESSNLELIFTTQPLNRCAVNVVVSFVMLMFFSSQAAGFVLRKCVLNRKEQIAFAKKENWVKEKEEMKDKKKKDVEKGGALDGKKPTAVVPTVKSPPLRESPGLTLGIQPPVGSPTDRHGSSTLANSVSSVGEQLVTPGNSRTGNSTGSNTKDIATPSSIIAGQTALERGSTKKQSSRRSQHGENTRAADEHQATPSALTTDPNLLNTRPEEAGLHKDTQIHSSKQPNPRTGSSDDATTQDTPAITKQSDQAKQESTSNTGPKTSKASPNDIALGTQGPKVDKRKKDNTTVTQQVPSDPESSVPRAQEPDKSQTSKSNSPSEELHSSAPQPVPPQPTALSPASQSSAPGSNTTIPKPLTPKAAVKDKDKENAVDPKINTETDPGPSPPPEQKSTRSSRTNSLSPHTPNHLTAEPAKSILTKRVRFLDSGLEPSQSQPQHTTPQNSAPDSNAQTLNILTPESTIIDKDKDKDVDLEINANTNNEPDPEAEPPPPQTGLHKFHQPSRPT